MTHTATTTRLTIAVLAASSLFLAGCEKTKYPRYESDRAQRAELFQVCMKLLPAGPVKTQYNDWDEVVAECADVAYRQSLYCYENCPPARVTKEGEAP